MLTRLISRTLVVAILLTSCSKLPFGDPGPPALGLFPDGPYIGVLVPLCKNETILQVEVTPDVTGSPAVAWSGRPRSGTTGKFSLNEEYFKGISGSYDVAKGYFIEVTTDKIIYAGVWNSAVKGVPSGSVRVGERTAPESGVPRNCN